MPSNSPTPIVVGMSGGVDSAVAALLLKEQGYAVQGLFMKNWEEDDEAGYCAAEEDLRDATAVCETLGIPLHTVNFAPEYWDRVFSRFLAEYRAGRTPNPDVLCNREIKFDAFLEHAKGLGAETIATGHYAGVRNKNGVIELLRAGDPGKDQTYFLHTLTQAQLSRAVFPLQAIHKTEVRDIARSAGFAIHRKKDSTGICFIGERRFREFLARYLPRREGVMKTPEGEIVGRHQGVAYYTLGQRQGLGIGGLQGAGEAPWYVAAKDRKRNELVVVQGHDHPLLYHSDAALTEMHWIAGAPPSLPLQCTARIRHRQQDQDCVVKKSRDEGCHIHFPRAQRAMTPGQYAVLYQGEVCLGGGIIAALENRAEQSAPAMAGAL